MTYYRPTLDGAKIGGGKVYHGDVSVKAWRASGCFTVHRNLSSGERQSKYWTVTLPCGFALGDRYLTRAAATQAAHDMAPLVLDWNANTLLGVFGREPVAREAFDMARKYLHH